MVKSTFSLGGKLLTIFLTLVIFIGAIAGALFAVYKNVKVRTLAGLIGQENWISESYDDTIENFIGKVSEALSGEISLQTLADISPALGEKMDAIVDNLENAGLFAVDRDVLYSTAVNQLTSNLSSLLIITASLNDLSETLNFTLPDLDIITGNEESPLNVYTQVTKDGVIDKAFSMSTTPYTYYTRTEVFYDTYTETITGDNGETEQTFPIVSWEKRGIYALTDIAADGNNLTYNGENLYLGKTSESGSVSYAQLTKNSDALYTLDEASGNAEFALADNEKLYIRALVETGTSGEFAEGYKDITPAQPVGSDNLPVIAAKYRYTPLYAKLDSQPAEGDFIQSGENYYVLATEKDENGYVVDSANGGFVILDEYSDEALYRLDYSYTEAEASAASAETPLFICTNGIGDLPVTYGITALSSFLDTGTMTLDSMGEYFGISMDNAMLDSLKYVPLKYISSSMTAEMNNIYVDDVITIDANSPAVLRYLAGYTLNEDGTLDKSGRRTIGELSGSLDGLTISSVVDVNENSHKLLQTIGDWTLNDIGNPSKIDSIALGDVLTIADDGSAPRILQVLANVPLGEISGKINSLALKDILDVSDSNILSNLANSTLDTLANDLKNLSVQQMYADDIYSYYTVETTDSSDRFTQLQQIYGAANLYILQGSEYVAATEENFSGVMLYSPYLLLNDTENYQNVPLYVCKEGEITTATKASLWKLSDKNISSLLGKTLYLKSEQDGKISYTVAVENVQESDLNKTFTSDSLWYWDSASEKIKEVSLVTAGIEVNETTNLLTRLSYVGTFSEGAAFEQGNLYYYDTVKEIWIPVPLQSSKDETGKIIYSVSESATIAEGTALYTYGTVRGVWKYLLTKDGAEITCSIQEIGSLVSNVKDNINKLTLKELHEDGMVTVSDPSVLNEEIPYDIIYGEGSANEQKDKFGGAETIGELRMNDLLNLTLAMISKIKELGNIPI